MMQIKKRYSVFACIFFSILFIMRGMEWSNTADTEVQFILLLLSVTVFLLKVYQTDYSVKQWLFAGLLLLLSIIIYYFSGKQQPVLFLLVIFCMKDVELEQVYKVVFWSSLAVITLSLFAMLLGFRENVIYSVERVLFGITYTDYRYSLGFFLPNCLFMYGYIAITSYFMMNKITNFKFLMSILVVLSLYMITKSRTGVILSMFFIVLLLPGVKKILVDKVLSRVTPYLMMLFVGCNLFFTSIYQFDANNWLNQLDKLLEYRISLSNYYLTTYPVKLFGQVIHTSDWKDSLGNPEDYKMIDNSYVLILVSYGLIFTVLFVSLYFFLFKKMCKNKQYNEVILLISMLVYGTSEVLVPNVFNNFTLIFASSLLFPANSHKEQLETTIKLTESDNQYEKK